jgi:hypothetical protein
MTVPAVLDSAGRHCSPATMPGYHAGRPPRNKGFVPGRPGDGSGDRRRDAPRPRGPQRLAAARDRRRALARRAARPRSARALRARPRRTARMAARPPRKGRTAPRDRHGRLGLGTDTALARRPPRAPGGPAVLHHRRADPRATLVKRRRPRRVPPARPGRCQAPLHAAPAAARPRRGARPRPYPDQEPGVGDPRRRAAKRTPLAPACASSPRGPTSTAAGSATNQRSRPRGCSPPRSTIPRWRTMLAEPRASRRVP